MEKPDPFRVAIVGYGLAGAYFHAPLLKSVQGLEICAIVTRSAEKQSQARNDFPKAQIYADFESLLANGDEIDLAVIATPNTEHASQAMRAMKAKLHVVIDKPMALNTQECAELISCSKENEVLISVFQNRRWDNDFLTIKRIISENRIGKILRFESRFERYRPAARQGAWREKLKAEEGGGILFDLGSHLIDQATQLFGQPEKIYAEMNVRREAVLSDDDSFLALSFPSGVQAHLWMSALAPSQGHRFRLLGSLGAYEKYGLDPQEDSLRAGNAPGSHGWGQEPESMYGILTTYDNGRQEKTALKSEPGSYEKFYEIMRDAMAGKGAVPVNPQDAFNTLKIIEAARESARSGKL